MDDDGPVRQLFAEGLEPMGIVVHAAASGAEALDVAAADSRVCVVLTDVRMPRMDGWDLERQLRRLKPELPVVLLTADRLLAIRGGPVRDKPLDPAEVAALVRSRCPYTRRS
ncbi:MAG TPA: response regulator [Candidatus Limnocylindria bacterium]